MPDYPDHTKPITITGITIESLPIDIVAQTVGNIAIDIAAQTVGNIAVNIAAIGDVTMNVNIAASVATLRVNLAVGGSSVRHGGGIKNPSFEEDFEAWFQYGDAVIDTFFAYTGGKSCKFPAGTDIDLKQGPLDPPIPTDLIEKFTLMWQVGDVGDGLGVTLYYEDGTSQDTIIFNTATATWQAHNVNFTAGKYIVQVEMWYDGTRVSDRYLDDFLVFLKPEMQADIISSVQIDMNIAAQTVDINIKTSGGVNLVIDKLTQTAYLEDRRTLSNDNGVTTPTAPPGTTTGTTFRGKFFPRGCRGFLRYLHVYCKRTAAGTLTLAVSPQMSMGEVYTVEITPGAAWDWKSGAVNKFWNYDSMFIWVKSCDADVSWGYESAAPFDAWSSGDLGATWGHVDNRYFFRAVMKAMTVGDLPVSGTLNVIEIPNLGGARQNVLITVPAASIEYDTVQPGSGRLLVAYFIAWTDGARDNLRPRILCDGVSILPFAWTFTEWSYGVSITSNGILLSGWDTTNHRYVICVLIPYPFKRSLQLGFGNISPDTQHQGYIGYCWEKTS